MNIVDAAWYLAPGALSTRHALAALGTVVRELYEEELRAGTISQREALMMFLAINAT